MQSQPLLHSSHGFEPLAAHVNTTVSKPDVLLFDLCGVLFDDTIWSRWLFQLVSRLGARLCYDQFVRGWEERYVPAVNSGQRDYWESVEHYLKSLALSRAAATEVCVAAKARRRRFDESIRPLPGTKTGLTKLAASGMKMAVIGNVPHDVNELHRQISHLGLSEYFAEVLASIEAGARPPSHMRYMCVAERLKVPPPAIWFISGSGFELRDAAAAGLSVIAWQTPQPLQSLPCIDHLQDLLPVIDRGRHHSLAG